MIMGRVRVKALLVLVAICSFSGIQSKSIKYKEDALFKQAPSKMVKLVDEVAKKMGYSGEYEVLEPKCINIADWPSGNKFIFSGLNIKTENNFISIDSKWMSSLKLEEQEFLIACCIKKFDLGFKPTVSVRYVRIVLFLILFLMFIWLLGKVRFFVLRKNRVRLLVAFPLALFVAGTSSFKQSETFSFSSNIHIDKNVVTRMVTTCGPNSKCIVDRVPVDFILNLLFLILSVFLLIMIFKLLGRVRFKIPGWIRFFIALYIVLIGSNYSPNLKGKCLYYFNTKHNSKISNIVLGDFPNKKAAVNALRYLDRNISKCDYLRVLEFAYGTSDKGMFAKIADEIECGHKKGCSSHKH